MLQRYAILVLKQEKKILQNCLKQYKATYTHKNIVNIYIAYVINLLNYVDSSDPTLWNSLFGAARLVKNPYIEK